LTYRDAQEWTEEIRRSCAGLPEELRVCEGVMNVGFGQMVVCARGEWSRLERDDHGRILTVWLQSRGNAEALCPMPCDAITEFSHHRRPKERD
jgi:hypothetical protein